jgi:hypothetical protein
MGKGTKKGGPEDWNLTDADEALLAAAQSGDLAAARAALDAGAKRECYSDVRAGGGTSSVRAGFLTCVPLRARAMRRGRAPRWRLRPAVEPRSTWR